MNITILSAITGIISLIVFIVSLAVPRAVKVGDIYAMGNPGNTWDPTVRQIPLVQMETVLEINEAKGVARVRVQNIDIDGKTQDREKWERLSNIPVAAELIRDGGQTK